jgi:hypothetical protein
MLLNNSTGIDAATTDPLMAASIRPPLLHVLETGERNIIGDMKTPRVVRWDTCRPIILVKTLAGKFAGILWGLKEL